MKKVTIKAVCDNCGHNDGIFIHEDDDFQCNNCGESVQLEQMILKSQDVEG
jgi:ribosomal protein S27E